MLTAMLAVKNILGANYDVWKVNVEKEYHEESFEQERNPLSKLASTQALVPQRIIKDAELKWNKYFNTGWL